MGHTTLGFDLRPLQAGFKAHKERGIGVYTRNIIERRNLKPDNIDIRAFHDPCYEATEAIKNGSSEYQFGKLFNFCGKFLKEYPKQHFALPRAMDRFLAKASVEKMYFPTHLDTPAGLKTPYAVTAHDMIHAALQEKFYTSFQHKIHIAKQIEVLQKASLIISVSEHTKKDVVKYANVDPSLVKVIYEGADPEFSPGAQASLERFNLPEKFILNVGGIDWRKNVELLFDSFNALLKTGSDIHLVMTGDIMSDPLYQRFLGILEERSLQSRALAIGFVSQAELAALYNKALLFFYPSLYEGFGLPVLEAMACGTPVITTNRTSIPEVAGDAAVSLDPDEPQAFAEALIRLVESDEERAALSKAGIKRASAFTWDKCAKETYEALAAF